MNKSNSVNYTGITNDLERRVWEHKNSTNENSFTSKYNINKLVYFEDFYTPESAIAREKQIKGLSREKKLNLIKEMNPEFKDLSEEWYRDEIKITKPSAW
jgi:putative endonuclease